jgi:hypothetical protein
MHQPNRNPDRDLVLWLGDVNGSGMYSPNELSRNLTGCGNDSHDNG